MSVPMPELDGVSHRYVAVDGLRMHVAEAGDRDAEPLLLLHGWPEHWYAWRKLIPPLAERYRLIVPDLRGFGWTDAPAGRYRKRELAADVLALLDRLELDRVRIAGHDWGGWAGFLLGLDHPERVSHLAAIGITHPWVRPEPGLGAALGAARRLAYMLPIATPLLGRELIARVPAFTHAVLRASAADPGATWTAADLEALLGQWRQPARAAAASALYRSFLTAELRELASGGFRDRTLEVPTVLIAGTRDPVIRPEDLGGFERNAPAMRLEALEDVGHWIPEEAPERTLAILERLFASG